MPTKIRNVRPYALEIVATGDVVEPGESVDIDDKAVAAALLDQPDNWQRAGASADDEAKAAAKAERARKRAEANATQDAAAQADDEPETVLDPPAGDDEVPEGTEQKEA